MTALHDAFSAAPLDDRMRAEIEGQGLSVARVPEERAHTDPWLDAVSRGFLGEERNDTHRQAFGELSAYRRKIGVFDAAAPQPEIPVATFASWDAELTLPGAVVPSCAVSSVTVAPTHRRRGILRSVMGGELRAAAAVGYPVAMLTVSESGIYGRFGFAPAAHATRWEIDTRRAGWAGPQPDGRIDFLSRTQGRALAPALHERIRSGMPGEVDMPGGHWDGIFGTRPDAEKAEKRRVVQYTSPEGAVDGVAVYRIGEGDGDFAASTLDVVALYAATDAAYAALWRFFLSMDLIGTVRASELSVDEPLWWMLADQRAAKITLRDHQYVRVLDVPATLEARTYDTDDSVVLEVVDALGFADGTFVLSVVDGRGEVDVVDAPPVGIPSVRLGVAELSAIVVGGVSPVTLARAGRLETDDPARLARLFATTAVPRLSFWY